MLPGQQRTMEEIFMLRNKVNTENVLKSVIFLLNKSNESFTWVNRCKEKNSWVSL